MSKFRSVAETSKAWGCSTQLTYRLIAQGRVKAETIDTFVVIDSKAKKPPKRRPGRPKSRRTE